MLGSRRLATPFVVQRGGAGRSAAEANPIRQCCASAEEDQIGTVTSQYALLDALDAANCGVADSVRNSFSRSELNVSVVSVTLDLVVVSVAELGITAERAPLALIYSQARKLGFTLAPVDAGPYLRLQYVDQPVGEFLNVGMDPIGIPDGESIILVVANGGAGLLLLSQDVGRNMQFFPSSQFVFVRPTIP